MMKSKNFVVTSALLVASVLFVGAFGAACAATEKNDDAVAVSASEMPKFGVSEHALMGEPKKLSGDPIKPVACATDADCFSLKYFQADQCNVAVKCINFTSYTGVCDVAVLMSCLDSETSPWPTGEGCNFAPDPDGACNDNNPCTEDYCNKYFFGGKGGCAHPQAAGETSCGTDGCIYKMPQCVNYASNPQTCDQFLAQYAGAACTDGNACTNGDGCGFQNGTFLCLPGAATSCDDANPCTDDSCDPAKGCVALPNAVTCDDASACTSGDACKDGKCGGTAKVCDDSNPCTDDSCDKVTGECKFTNNTSACDDANACTSGDACKDGKCEGAAVNCDDANVCTDDYCNKKSGCEHLPNAVTCDDANACTSGDACKDGKCEGAAVNCDDANPCTDDACGKVSGCVHANNTNACNDSDACTSGDACKDGKCAGTAVNCDDANPCTDDSCDKVAGCKNIANAAPCTDNDACTSGDKCEAGKCVVAAVNCDDGNTCTNDSCDKVAGCQHANNTLACNDSDKCTEGDVCKDGKCAGVNVCTPEAQNCADGKDNDKNGAIDCQDGACKDDPLCSQQACLPVASVACNASWPVSVSGKGVINKYSCAPPVAVPGPEKFWKFQADKDYVVGLKLTDTSDKHLVVALKGACKPSACETTDYKVVSFQAKAGEVFFVGVDTLPGAFGNGMTMEVSCTPVAP